MNYFKRITVFRWVFKIVLISTWSPISFYKSETSSVLMSLKLLASATTRHLWGGTACALMVCTLRLTVFLSQPVLVIMSTCQHLLAKYSPCHYSVYTYIRCFKVCKKFFIYVNLFDLQKPPLPCKASSGHSIGKVTGIQKRLNLLKTK